MFIISIGFGGLSYAQPKIPKENIPSDISSNVRKQIERLYSTESKERVEGAYYLGKMGAKAVPAIPFLIAILQDDAVVQKATLFSFPFYEWHSPAGEAARALSKIGKPSVKPLIAAFKDKDENVRMNVAWALGKIGDKQAIEPLITALKDENSGVRWWVADALGNISDIRAVQPLIVVLKEDNDDIVRQAAARALGNIGDSATVESLIAALKDKKSEVKEEAIKALGKIGDIRAIEPLITFLEDETYIFRQKLASRTLKKITGQRFGENPIRWREWWEKNKQNFKKN